MSAPRSLSINFLFSAAEGLSLSLWLADKGLADKDANPLPEQALPPSARSGPTFTLKMSQRECTLVESPNPLPKLRLKVRFPDMHLMADELYFSKTRSQTQPRENANELQHILSTQLLPNEAHKFSQN